MPEVPPLHEFVMRYPAFEAVLPSRVEPELQEAANSLSVEALGERVWRTAVMLKTAHVLTQSGLGSGVESALAAQGMAGFTSVSDGQVSASRPNPSGTETGYSTTSYGRALAHLLRHHAPRAMVAAPLPVPGVALGSPTTRRG